MLCKDHALAHKMWFVFTDEAQWFHYLDGIIPYAAGKPASWTNTNGQLIDYVELGDHIDFESIMIYGSDLGGVNVMTKRGTEETWEPGQKPSKGDVEAVKLLYPDIA